MCNNVPGFLGYTFRTSLSSERIKSFQSHWLLSQSNLQTLSFQSKYSCFGSLTGDTFFSKTNCLSDNSSFFATALTCEGTTEGETSHSLITWRTAKLSLIDGNLSRLVLGAITKPNPALSVKASFSIRYLSKVHLFSSSYNIKMDFKARNLKKEELAPFFTTSKKER